MTLAQTSAGRGKKLFFKKTLPGIKNSSYLCPPQTGNRTPGIRKSGVGSSEKFGISIFEKLGSKRQKANTRQCLLEVIDEIRKPDVIKMSRDSKSCLIGFLNNGEFDPGSG